MSHVTAVSLEVSDLKVLKAACDQLGLEFCEGQKTWKWVGRWYNDYGTADAAYNMGVPVKDYGKSAHAIKLAGCAFEIGVVANEAKPGTYLLAYDFVGPGRAIMDKLGKGLEKLKQAYGEQATLAFARRKGYAVARSVSGGKVTLKLSVRR